VCLEPGAVVDRLTTPGLLPMWSRSQWPGSEPGTAKSTMSPTTTATTPSQRVRFVTVIPDRISAAPRTRM
jgi:hypothetical protein